jgi:hypothetical protein
MPGERFLVATPDSSQEDEICVFGESCQDINGRTITGGNHYVPGPDSCTVCLCDGGKPKWCQAVLCAAPKVHYNNKRFLKVKQMLIFNKFIHRIANLSELEVLAVNSFAWTTLKEGMMKVPLMLRGVMRTGLGGIWVYV